MAAPKRRGPALPYELLAAILPSPAGWLVVGGRLQGASLAAEVPSVEGRFIDVLDHRPAYSVVALHLPLGLPSRHQPGGRSCDRAARRLLRMPRSAAIASPPSREDLDAWRAGKPAQVSAVTASLLPRIAEVYDVIGSYHQRSVFEAHPELSFYLLNDQRPLRHPKHTAEGRAERAALLEARVPGAGRSLAHAPSRLADHVADALAMLWTARRIFAHAVARLPEDPEWDAEGLRMELVY